MLLLLLLPLLLRARARELWGAAPRRERVGAAPPRPTFASSPPLPRRAQGATVTTTFDFDLAATITGGTAYYSATLNGLG